MDDRLPRLSNATTRDLPGYVARPRYDRTQLSTGIVHLGVGAFHRAHQAIYTEACLAAGDLRWGILGASLRSGETRDALQLQDHLFTVAARDQTGERLDVVGGLRSILVAGENPKALVEAMARPQVKIVTLTITEKGYCHDPATAELNEAHPDVLHDLRGGDQPRSALGFLSSALAARRKAGVPPFTIVSCDNLPANGRTLKAVLSRFAQLKDRDFGRYVLNEVACPSTMVDRIVPATTPADRASISQRLGLEDRWPVVTEPFTQWVIEDDFPHGRPDWALAGAELVSNVAPYESMKLKLLNASHSAIAYLGSLAGFETVADAMAYAPMSRFVRELMDEEVTPTLVVPSSANVDAYKSALIRRFQNPALAHRTRQIAMDGTQKLPQRWLQTIEDRLAKGAPIPRLAFAVAAWMRYVTGVDEHGQAFVVQDPLADVLRLKTAAVSNDPKALASSLLTLREVFSPSLASNPNFREAVTHSLSQIVEMGAAAALQKRAWSV